MKKYVAVSSIIATAIIMSVVLIPSVTAKITGWSESEMTLLFDALDSNQDGVMTGNDWWDKVAASSQNNLSASVAPDADNDIDEGYTVGSVWVDTTADMAYICLDNTDGAAVWEETSGAGTTTIVREEFIPISWFVFNGTNDPGEQTETASARYRDFSSSAAGNGEFFWMAPTGLTGTTVKIRAVAIITSTTTPANNEGVSWGMTACSSGTNDDHNCTGGTSVNSEDSDLDDDAGAQWDLVMFPYITVTPTDLAGGESVKFFFERDIVDADDDYGQSIGLIGVMIKWNENLTTLTY